MDIVRSGAYQVESFRPTPKRDSVTEKRKLQNLMATGRPSAEEDEEDFQQKSKPTRFEDDDFEDDEFGRLLGEVRERKKWLTDMKELGALKREDLTKLKSEIALVKFIELQFVSYKTQANLKISIACEQTRKIANIAKL